MEILRRYCMGGESVGFQIVSDQKECLRSVVTGRANYEDEYYSVDMPIFAIHGNHDDPTRDGGTELLSALDLLSVSNLINYFGRQDQVDNVQVSPVLLQKGGTKVALYGMGSMRDERLNRMWQGKKVKFLRPEEDDNRRRRGGEEDEEEDNGGSGWFNIFTLHQNRDLGRGSKNCVHVWGHEHECLITPQESLVGTFRISQPGSSVATSLTQGEGRQKHVGILDIRGQQFRLKSIPLGSVRGFAIGDVSLTELAEGGTVLDIEDPKLEERMGDVLAAEVENLIKRAREEAEQHRQDAANHAKEALTLEDEFDPDKRQRNYTLQSPEQVLVRLKVEHSGFTTLNNQRFGSRFVGEVANPSDILLFHRRRQAENTTAKGAATKKKRAAAGMYDPTEPEELEEVNVEDLVNENLFNMDKKLELLTEREMGEALDDFVSKEQKQAIGDMAAIILRKSQKTLTSRGKKEGEDSIEVDNAATIREFCMSKTERSRAELAMEREEAAQNKKKKQTDASQKVMDELSPTKKKKSRDFDDELSDDDDSPPPKKRATKAKAATTSKKNTTKSRKVHKSRARVRSDSDDDEIEFVGSSQAPSKKPAARTGRARAISKKPKYNYDEDSDVQVDELDDDSEEEQPRKKVFKTTGRGRGRATYQDDHSDDNEDEVINGGGRGWGTASSQNMRRGRR
eukprot:scaffold609_cov198-Alexandrium_tamarense.AAC.37